MLEVSTFQERHQVCWYASDGRTMEGRSVLFGKRCSMFDFFHFQAGEMDQGATTLVLRLAEAVDRVSLPVVWTWRRMPIFTGRFCLCSAFIPRTSGQFSVRSVSPSLSKPLLLFSLS